MFCDQIAFSLPCLIRFMDTTENQILRFDRTKFEFSEGRLRVETYLHEENSRCSFSINVDCSHRDGNISAMAQIVDKLGQAFSAVEHLILENDEDGRSSEEDRDLFEVNGTEWRRLLMPFSNVKDLRVGHGLVEEFSCYLRLKGGGLPSELLPKLQELTYYGSVIAGGAFTSLVDVRQKAGHLVSLIRRSPSPRPSLASDEVWMERPIRLVK